MPETFLVTIPVDAISPLDRGALKDILGDTVRAILGYEGPVAVDHLGTPIADLNQAPDREVG